MAASIANIRTSLKTIEKGWKPYATLILLCSFYYIPGLTTFPATDRDESRFAQASRQMLESGNYVDIRFQHTPRHKKPIGIYWLQAASVAMTVGPESSSIWAYRLPSFAGATIAVLLTFYFGQTWFGKRTALLGAALLGSTLLLTVEAHLAKTDAVLLACIVLMQGSLGRIYTRLKKKQDTNFIPAMVFWGACGLGVLIKGPISLIVACMTVLALALSERDVSFVRQLHPGKGLILLLIIVLPWFIAISLSTRGAFIKDALFSDLIPKLISGHESHGAPPGYYLLLFSALFWPSSVFAFWSIRPGWKFRSDPSVRFCLAWIVPVWLMFELIPTKLPHYVLPTFPAIALLTAHSLLTAAAPAQQKKRLLWILKWIPIVLWVIIGLSLCTGLTVLPLALNQRFFFSSIPVIFGTLLIFVSAGYFWASGRLHHAVISSLLGGVLVFAPAFSSILPHLEGPWISQTIFSLLQKQRQDKHSMLAAVGYKEPSLVFLMGTETALTNVAGAVEHLKKYPANGVALIRDEKENAFKAAARRVRIHVVPLETIRGFNYSKGKWLTLTLYATHNL